MTVTLGSLVKHFDERKAGRRIRDLVDISNGEEYTDNKGEEHHRVANRRNDDATRNSSSDFLYLVT